MNKPITIPCVLITNFEQIEECEKMGIEPPKETRVLHDIIFTNIDMVEKILDPETDQQVNPITFVYVNGLSRSTTLTVPAVLNLMRNNGWFD